MTLNYLWFLPILHWQTVIFRVQNKYDTNTYRVNINFIILTTEIYYATRQHYKIWCYYYVIASAFPAHTHRPPRNHCSNKSDITVPDGSPIEPKTFRFHFGETIFRLNSHWNPYIYGRHVDISSAEHTRFTIKLSVEYSWRGQNRSFCCNE